MLPADFVTVCAKILTEPSFRCTSDIGEAMSEMGLGSSRPLIPGPLQERKLLPLAVYRLTKFG